MAHLGGAARVSRASRGGCPGWMDGWGWELPDVVSGMGRWEVGRVGWPEILRFHELRAVSEPVSEHDGWTGERM